MAVAAMNTPLVKGPQVNIPQINISGVNSVQINQEQGRASFFQSCVERMLTYWQGHDAVKNIDVIVLDRERHRILKNIVLGLDLQPIWPLVKTLVIAFAPYMERRGHWDAWHGVLEQAIRMAQRAKDLETETILTTLLARLCQRMSRPQDVVRHYSRVIKLARQAGNRYEEARACSNLGYLYIDGGYWWRSEVLSKHALTIFEELGSDHGRAHTHNHLGSLFIRQRRWSEAEQQLQDACCFWQVMSDEHGLLRGFINFGLMHLEMEQPVEALVYLERALDQTELTGEQAEIGMILMNMGLAHVQGEDLAEARRYSLEAERLFRQYSSSIGLALVQQNLGLICLRQTKMDDAREYFEHSLAGYHKLNNWDGEIKVLLDLVDYDMAVEDWPQAALRLTELERLLNQYNLAPNHDLAKRVQDKRHSLCIYASYDV